MDPFGSRKDDPLLQGDPFAPPSDEDDASGDGDTDSEDARDDEATGGDATADGEDLAPENRAPVQAGEAKGSGEATDQSVFEDSGPRFAFDGDGDTRIVVRSAEGASEGRLTVLNAAFEQGWTLDRVELRNEGEGKEPGTSIAFVLRQAENG